MKDHTSSQKELLIFHWF